LNDLIAGVASGLMVSSLVLGVGAVAAIRFNRELNQLGQRLPGGVSPLWVYLLVTAVIPPTGAALGALFGVALSVLNQMLPGAGAGSPNLAFSLVTILFWTPLVLGAFIFGRRVRWEVASVGLILVVGFGWLLPWMAV
jgi:hypothetical protein